VLQINGVTEAFTLGSELIARQCEIEERYSLTFFDSFIGASTLRLDSVIISDDRSFDKLPGMMRIGLSEASEK
jgi:predicted nucleic acid-binding protein